MNPLTNVKNITKLNETELATGSIHKKSWHDMYKDSAWVFIGGLEYGLTEGDVIAVFSQYGEIENINLVRDKKTGKSKGYSFLCYSNQKSTILAVDNLNGIKLCNRTIRVDHVANYKPPKENERDDEVTKVLKSEGCAPQVVQKFKAKETSEVQNDGTSENRKKSKKECPQCHRNFVSEPMGDKGVNELAGIGEVLSKRLEAKGFVKCKYGLLGGADNASGSEEATNGAVIIRKTKDLKGADITLLHNLPPGIGIKEARLMARGLHNEYSWDVRPVTNEAFGLHIVIPGDRVATLQRDLLKDAKFCQHVVKVVVDEEHRDYNFIG